MKNKAGLIFPLLIVLFGAYALFATLSSGGEQVTLLSDHQIPWGLGLIFGLLGLGGGSLVIISSLAGKKRSS
jgi:hypothetical protein